MRRRDALSLAAAGLFGAGAGCLGRGGEGPGDGSGGDGTGGTGTPPPSPAGGVAVERVAEGLTRPWAIEFVPGDSRVLVTERVGRLLLVDRRTGDVETVAGTPSVYARGQGGLLDVALDPRYPDREWVYLTYAVAGDGATSSTRLARGRLDAAAPRLRDLEVLYTAEPFVESTGHFGSRVAFDDAGDAYVTVGDRQFKDFGPDHVAQQRSNDLGTTLRLRPDGSVPPDNPFVDDPDARDAIYSYGHRNAQGLAVHPETGDVWESEFGERDGDEINVLERGANYGWPVADESCRYGTDDPVGVAHDDREDVVAPVYGWPCGSGGFPPSGIAFYTGDAVPEWRGDLFVGGLASRALARFGVDGRTVTDPERLLGDRGWRVRAVADGPDGFLYLAVDAADAPLVRLVPA